MIKILDLFGTECGIIPSCFGEETMELTAPKHEEGACILFRNNGSEEVSVTVKAGNSIYATDDITVTAGTGDVGVISLKDSGRFKNVHGENSGKIIVKITGEASEVEICALYL